MDMALTAFLGLNVLWRLIRYGMDFPLWGDEARVAINLIDRSPGELAEPLDWLQVVPFLFLQAEWVVRHTLGIDESALRLIPVAAGITGMVLAVRLARQLLPPSAAAAAVALLAASYYPVRHATEIKPYSLDLLAAVALILLSTRALRTERGLSALSASACVAVWFSYTAVFVVAACWSTIAIERRRDPRAVRDLTVAGVPVAASFAAMYWTVGRVQAEAGRFLWELKHWDFTFPPLSTPSAWPGWLLDVHTGNLVAYPNGGNEYGSSATFLLLLAGVASLWRQRRFTALRLLLLPLGFNLAAACFYMYPYGGSARVAQYAAPSICILAGTGVVAVANQLRIERIGLQIWLGLMGILLIGGIAHSIEKPYKHRADTATRLALERLADRTPGTEAWVVFAALDPDSDAARFAPVLPRVPGSKGWGGSWARTHWYLQAHSPTKAVHWAPPPSTLDNERPTLLIAYRDDTNPFPTGRFDTYRDAVAERLGQPVWGPVTIELHRSKPEQLILYGYSGASPVNLDDEPR